MQDQQPQIFHLNLKKQWFDMIAIGEKKEEYRELKPYWNKRFKNNLFKKKGVWYPVEAMVLCFRNGYSADAPTIYIEVKSITIRTGKDNWGAQSGKKYWVLELGQDLLHQCR
jgi:hypothetical protein